MSVSTASGTMLVDGGEQLGQVDTEGDDLDVGLRSEELLDSLADQQ